MRDEHELLAETIEEREQRLDEEARELDLHNFKAVALPVLALFIFAWAVICCIGS
jgi:hypothetical protein